MAQASFPGWSAARDCHTLILILVVKADVTAVEEEEEAGEAAEVTAVVEEDPTGLFHPGNGIKTSGVAWAGTAGDVEVVEVEAEEAGTTGVVADGVMAAGAVASAEAGEAVGLAWVGAWEATAV